MCLTILLIEIAISNLILSLEYHDNYIGFIWKKEDNLPRLEGLRNINATEAKQKFFQSDICFD